MHISGVNKTYEKKVEQLEDCAGNITSQGFIMVEDLNAYFV